MNSLNTISEIHTGYNFRSVTNTKRQTVYLISAKDLSNNFTGVEEIEIPDSYKNHLKDGDILVKSRGANYEAKVFKSPNHNHPYIAANTLIIVRLTTKDYKPSYIAQIINSLGAQQYLRSLSSGQTVPILAPASLGSLNCPKAPLEKQDQLETITKTIDDYQIALTKYLEAQEKLSKALQNKIIEGAK